MIMLIGVLGGGTMGGGIMEVAAAHGHHVILRSRSIASAEATVAKLDKSLAKQVDRGRIDQRTADDTRARACVTSEIEALRECDLVIESVVEDLAVKLELFRQLDDVCKPGTILATNTSTLPVVDMAMATSRPDQVCGVHFFNPAPAMDLVEIVRPITAGDATIEAVTAFVEGCGKDAVVVKDQAGFVVNALLFPYLNNAIKLLESGVADVNGIDTAMRGGCGFPMGPFALLDLVGLDTSLAILEALYAEFGDPNFAPAPRLRRMVAAGHLGRKSGQGFMSY